MGQPRAGPARRMRRRLSPWWGKHPTCSPTSPHRRMPSTSSSWTWTSRGTYLSTGSSWKAASSESAGCWWLTTPCTKVRSYLPTTASARSCCRCVTVCRSCTGCDEAAQPEEALCLRCVFGHSNSSFWHGGGLVCYPQHAVPLILSASSSFHVPSFSDIIRPKLGIPDESSPHHLALESPFVAHLTYEHPQAQENRNCSAACFEPLKLLSPKFSLGHDSGMDRIFCTGGRLSWSHPASVTSIGKGTT